MLVFLISLIYFFKIQYYKSYPKYLFPIMLFTINCLLILNISKCKSLLNNRILLKFDNHKKNKNLKH